MIAVDANCAATCTQYKVYKVIVSSELCWKASVLSSM